MATVGSALRRRSLLGGIPALGGLSTCAPDVPDRRPVGHDLGTGEPVAFDNPVATWIDLASRIGSAPDSLWPRTNTVALTMRAIHDSLNAIEARYARWLPREPTEPPGAGASPLVAASVAAHAVLIARGPRAEADALLTTCLAREPSGSARAAGVALGTATGTATLARAGSTAPERWSFAVSDQQGMWRPTSVRGDNTYFFLDPPFLFPDRSTTIGRPPPDLSSALYREVLDEVRHLGGTTSTLRTAEQAEAARFWVPQLLHRNLMIGLLLRLTAQPPRGGLWDVARMVSILATANADAEVFGFGAKAHFSFWRPVTAINLGSPGITADPLWQPLLATPAHPDHPSGHSVDISTGTHVIAGLLGNAPLRYEAFDRQGRPTRDFASPAAVRRECSDSRIWAGAHFRTACEEGERIGQAIAARALAQVSPIKQEPSTTRP